MAYLREKEVLSTRLIYEAYLQGLSTRLVYEEKTQKSIEYLKSAIFFHFNLNKKNKVLLKKKVWKKIFAGGRRGQLIFN